MYKSKKGALMAQEYSTPGIGESLLAISLICDGLVGAVQERMKSEFQTKSGHIMRAMSLWAILYLGVMLVATGEIFEFSTFVTRHPSIVGQLATYYLAGALGQVSSTHSRVRVVAKRSSFYRDPFLYCCSITLLSKCIRHIVYPSSVF